MRSIADRNILDEFTTTFCNVVERHTDYIVVSGFVAIASGRTRGTEDIDMIIKSLSQEEFTKLHNDLTNEFICIQGDDPKDIHKEYLTKGLSVRYTWKDKMLPEMELKFAKDELDDYQLSTKTKLPLTGLDIWFSNINVNIAFKEYLLKSDKDFEDAKHLRIAYEELVNKQEINKVKHLIEKHR